MDQEKEIKTEELLHYDYSVENTSENEKPKPEELGYFGALMEQKVEEPGSECSEDFKLDLVKNPYVARKPGGALWRPSSRRCLVCYRFESSENFSYLTSKNKKLLLIVGLILGGQMTLENAELIMGLYRIYTCNIHLTEALDQIFKKLNIKSVEELRTCSKDNVKKLMNVVNMLTEKPVALKRILPEFVQRIKALSKKPQNRICIACSKFSTDPDDVTTIRSEVKRLILLTGAVLTGKIEMDEAKFMMVKYDCWTCRAHLSEALDKIFEILKIKTLDGLEECNVDNELLRTFDELAEKEHDELEFKAVLKDYVLKMDPLEAERYLGSGRSKSRNKKPKDRMCDVCSSIVNIDTTIEISCKTTQLILMIGRILAKKKTKEEVESMTSSPEFRSCQVHLLEAGDEIFAFLNIKHNFEISFCPEENKRNLMAIVNSLHPDFKFVDFYRFLDDFFYDFPVNSC
ncbi:unnamed protein product [Caenorhabditis brenneri]